MLKATSKTTRSGYGSDTNGKCICVSFPLHELYLLNDLDELAESQYVTRSQLLRRWIRHHRRELTITNKN